MNIYNEEKVLLPLMIFQNFINIINSDFKECIDTIINIYDSLSYSDMINTNMFINQNWELQDIYGHFSCVKTSNYLKNLNKKKNPKIDFTIDLNKLSQKNVNKNTLRLLLDKLDIELNDIKYLNLIINKVNLNTKLKTYINKFK